MRGYIADLTNAVAVNAGEDHCLMLKSDGTVISFGAEGVTPLNVSNVVAMATGRSYGFGNGLTSDLALRNDGTVVGLFKGRIEEGSLSKEMTNVTAIAKGGAATFLLNKDGRVFGMGVNDRGQATGVKTTNYIASGYVSINGQLLTDVTAIAAGQDMNLALKRDGTVVAWGGIGMAGKPIVPEGLSNAVAIAAGLDYCLAITTNRAVAERFMSKSK
jgi:alpha-tubulin suppressor-like RCC1 family protein